MVKISGVITDIQSGEALPAATVWDSSGRNGTVSNTYGHYSMVVSRGAVTLQVSFIGYQTHLIQLEVSADTLVNIQLSGGVSLDEMTVIAPSSKGVTTSMQMGQLQLPINDVVWAPSVAGESNLIAGLKTLAGVSAGREGGSELFVRGGRHDQNFNIIGWIASI